jgi:hypothetical protein
VKAEIICPDYGLHNRQMDESIRRLTKSGVYKDLSTIIIIPAIDAIPPKVVSSWLNLMSPPNQKVFRLFAMGMEIGEAYSQCIENILAHPDLSKFRYILTIEADNIPPPDGLIKLLSDMENNTQFSCIGGLYYTKGYDGVPQIWGDPKSIENNYRPQVPIPNTIQECCGTGMGFNLFSMEMFKDKRIDRPLFRTLAGTEGCATQDLQFWGRARLLGYRCAVDTALPVGHYDFKGSYGPEDTVY